MSHLYMRGNTRTPKGGYIYISKWQSIIPLWNPLAPTWYRQTVLPRKLTKDTQMTLMLPLLRDIRQKRIIYPSLVPCTYIYNYDHTTYTKKLDKIPSSSQKLNNRIDMRELLDTTHLSAPLWMSGHLNFLEHEPFDHLRNESYPPQATSLLPF